MTSEESQPHPWDDVALPRELDARDIYEYATTVGEERRQQRSHRHTVLTAFSCILVVMSAIAIVLSRSDASTNVSVAGAPPLQPGISPSAQSPLADAWYLPAPDTTPTTHSKDTNKAALPSVTPDPRRTRSTRCRVVPMSTAPHAVQLVAFRGQVTEETTTTVDTTPPPPTTTTTQPKPPPPRTTTTVKRHTPPPPPRTTTTIVISPQPPLSSPPPNAATPKPPPRIRC